MGVFDSNLGVVKNQLAGKGTPSLSSLDDVLRQARLAAPSAVPARTLPPLPDVTRGGRGPGADVGGWEGFVTDILNSAPGKIITKAADVISIPGRAVTSVVQELADALDSDPNTIATWNDFARQTMDPTFGFGTVIGDLTGSKWVDRALGFVGDIVLDPLTYLTLGTTKAASATVDAAGNVVKGAKIKSIASAEGRFAMADKLKELGADPQLVKDVLRRGRSAVSDKDLLARAGYDRAGVYWMGKRIPGSTRIGEAAERTFTGFRVWSGDHIFKRVGELFTPEDMMDARRKLARGDVPAEKVGDLMNLVLSRNTERATEAAALREAGQIRINSFSAAGVDEPLIKAHRANLYKKLEKNGGPIDPSTPDGKLATAVREHLNTLRGKIVAAGQELEPGFNVGFLNDYVPEVATDNAWRWMGNTNDRGAVLARGQTFDVFEPSGSFKTRKQKGDTIGKHVLTQDDIDAGIDRMNEIYRREFNLNFDFFETDIVTIVDKYERMYAAMQGKIARKKFLIDRGTFQRLSDRLVTDPELEKVVQKQLAKVVALRATKLKAASTSFEKLGTFVKSIIDDDLLKSQAPIDAAAREFSEAVMTEGGLSYKKSSLMRQISQARDEVNEAFNTFQNNIDFANQSPLIMEIDDRVEQILSEIDSIADDINTINFAEPIKADMMNRVVKGVEGLQKRIDEAIASEEKIIQNGNTLNTQLENILSGVDIPGMIQIGKDLRGAITGGLRPTMGGDPLIKGQKISKKMADERLAGLEGIERELMEETIKREELYSGAVNQEWWNEISSLAPIYPTTVIGMAAKGRVLETIQKVLRSGGDRGNFGSTSTLEELRNVGVVLMAWMDTLPDDIADGFIDIKEDLLEGIKQASETRNHYERISKIPKSSKGNITIGGLIDNYEGVVKDTRNLFFGYFEADDLLNKIFQNVDLETMADDLVPQSLINQIISDDDYAHLHDYFAPFARKRTVDRFDDIRSLMGATETLDNSEGMVRGTLVGGRQVDEMGFEPGRKMTFKDLADLLESTKSKARSSEFEITLRSDIMATGSSGTRPLQDVFDKTAELAEVPDNRKFSLASLIDDFERAGRKYQFQNITYKGKNAQSEYIQNFFTPYRQWHMAMQDELRKRGINPSDRRAIKIFDENIARASRSARAKVSKGQISKEQGKQIVKDAQDEFTQAIDDQLRPGTVLTAEEAHDRLTDLISRTYFNLEVQSRYSSVLKVMGAHNLVPGNDAYRKVINAVARDLGEGARVRVSTHSYASSRLDEIIDLIDGATGEKDRLVAIINDPQSTPQMKREAQKELRSLPESGGWLGREQDLLDRVSDMLRRSGPEYMDDWRSIVSAANGRHDAQHLLRELQYWGGATDTSGVKNRLRRLNVELSQVTDPMQRESILAEIASLPTNEAIAQARKDLLKNKLRPWYRKNVNSSKKSPTFKEIYDELKKYKAVVKRGGRLEEGASVQEIRDWVVAAKNNVENSARSIRKAYGWTLEASDEFIDTSRFKIGVGTTQELPTIQALSLRRAAQDLEDDLAVLERSQRAAAKTYQDVQDILPKEKQAAYELQELQRPGGRISGIVPVEEEAKVRVAKDAVARVAELKNTTMWASAAERSELNEIVGEMAKYASDATVPLYYEVAPKEVALELMSQGKLVFTQKGAVGNPEEILQMKRLQKEINDITKVFAAAEGSLAEAGNWTIDELRKEITRNKEWAKIMKPYFDMADDLIARGQREEAERVVIEGASSLPQSKVRRVTGELSVGKPERKLEDRIRFAKLKYDRDVKIRQLESLTKRNPFNEGTFELVSKPHRLKDGTLYFTVSDGAVVNSADIKKRYKQALKLAQEGRLEEARQIESDIRQMMTVIQPRVSEFKAGGQVLSVGPDDFRGLFDETNEFVIDVTDKGVVKQYPIKAIALQRASDILQLIKSGQITKEDFFKALSYTTRRDLNLYQVSSEVFSSRRAALSSAWNSSKDKALLDEVMAIENSGVVQQYMKLLSDRRATLDLANQLRAKAKLALGDVAEEGAEFGFEPYNIGVYTRTYRSEYSKFVAAEIERIMRSDNTYNFKRAETAARAKAEKMKFKFSEKAIAAAKSIPRKEPVLGVKGAQYRFTKSFNRLNGIFDSIKRSTGEMYDPYTRFNDLTAEGLSYGDAVKRIVDEVESLRLPDPNFVDVANSAKKYVDEAESLMFEIPFVHASASENVITRLAYAAAGWPADKPFDFSAKEGIARMDRLGEELDRLEFARKELFRKQMQPSYEVRKYSKKAKAMGREEIYGDQLNIVKSAKTRLKQLEDALAKMSIMYDNASTAKMELKRQQDLLIPMLQQRVNNVRNAQERISQIVSSDASLEVKHAELSLWLDESEDLLSQIGRVADPIQREKPVTLPSGVVDASGTFKQEFGLVEPTFTNTKDYEKFLTLKANYLNSWQELSIVDDFYSRALKTVEDLKDEKWGDKVVKELEKGFVTLEQMGLPSFYASRELAEMTMNMQKMIQPEFVRGINRFIGRYTGFFKAYATSTPGFVVRNTMSNTFMLVAGGVNPKNMIDGLDMFRAWRKALADGTEAKFLSSLDKRGKGMREIFDLAVQASDASGYGRSAESFAGWVPKRKGFKDNRYTELFRKWNETSEGSARFIMAYDSVVNGSDLNNAVARVKKYFFDYQDVSGADIAMRSVIPFWYWMSRNLPLQITNTWANPRPYLMYDKIMKAISEDEEDNFTPSWMVAAGAVRLGDGMYALPDLGFSRIQEDATKLLNPLSGEFLDMLNPAIKVPIELITNRRLRYGQDFREEGQQVAAGPFSPAVQALAGLLGPMSQERPTPGGEMGVTDKFNYATRAMLPMLGQAERILPGTETGRANVGNSWLSYLGVPIRTVTDEDRNRERERQIREQNALRERAIRGY